MRRAALLLVAGLLALPACSVLDRDAAVPDRALHRRDGQRYIYRATVEKGTAPVAAVSIQRCHLPDLSSTQSFISAGPPFRCDLMPRQVSSATGVPFYGSRTQEREREGICTTEAEGTEGAIRASGATA